MDSGPHGRPRGTARELEEGAGSPAGSGGGIAPHKWTASATAPEGSRGSGPAGHGPGAAGGTGGRHTAGPRASSVTHVVGTPRKACAATDTAESPAPRAGSPTSGRRLPLGHCQGRAGCPRFPRRGPARPRSWPDSERRRRRRRRDSWRSAWTLTHPPTGALRRREARTHRDPGGGGRGEDSQAARRPHAPVERPPETPAGWLLGVGPAGRGEGRSCLCPSRCPVALCYGAAQRSTGSKSNSVSPRLAGGRPSAQTRPVPSRPTAPHLGTSGSA